MNKCFIIWRWEHLLHQKVYHRTRSVEKGTEQSLIFEINENIDFNDLKLFLQEHLSDEKSACLVLIHRKAFLLEQKQELTQLWKPHAHVVFKQFGGGSDFIYFDPDTGSGLLDQDGNWAHDLLFTRSDNEDVIAQIFNDGDELIHQQFSPIWRHYFHRYLSRVYENRVNLLNYLDIHLIKSKLNGTVATMAPNHVHDLDLILSEMQENYDETVTAAMAELQNYIHHEPVNSHSELRELNRHFVHLLESVKEVIY